MSKRSEDGCDERAGCIVEVEKIKQNKRGHCEPDWPGLFTVLVSMRTQERASKQVVTSKSTATHPVRLFTTRLCTCRANTEPLMKPHAERRLHKKHTHRRCQSVAAAAAAGRQLAETLQTPEEGCAAARPLLFQINTNEGVGATLHFQL